MYRSQWYKDTKLIGLNIYFLKLLVWSLTAVLSAENNTRVVLMMQLDGH